MSSRLPIRAGSCPVCGSSAVHTDTVEWDVWLMLAECPRCDHRWTQALHEPPAVVRAAVRAEVVVRPEVANAA